MLVLDCGNRSAGIRMRFCTCNLCQGRQKDEFRRRVSQHQSQFVRNMNWDGKAKGVEAKPSHTSSQLFPLGAEAPFSRARRVKNVVRSISQGCAKQDVPELKDQAPNSLDIVATLSLHKSLMQSCMRLKIESPLTRRMFNSYTVIHITSYNITGHSSHDNQTVPSNTIA